MKTRLLIILCLSLLLISLGCKKKTQPAPADTNQPSTASTAVEETPKTKDITDQPALTQTTAPAPVVEKPTPAKPASSKQPLAQTSEDSDTDYYAILMEGKKVGYAVYSRSVEGDTVTSSQQAKITISRMGIPITINTTEKNIETVKGEPLGFESVQSLSAMTSKTTGRIDPNGTVFIESTAGGIPQKSTIQWPEGAVMTEGLRLITEEKGLKEGVEYTVKVFSPGVQQAIETTTKIGPKKNVDLLGRVVPLYETTSSYFLPGAGKITSTSYMDDNFEMQKDTMPLAGMSVEIIACAKEFALGQNDVLELINKMFLKSPEEISNLSTIESIGYGLTSKGEEPVTADSFPSNDNQTAKDLPSGAIFLTVHPVAAPTGASFPYKGNDEELLAALKSNSYLQSDDAVIKNLARQAVGDAKDAAQAARNIESFVANYISSADLSVGYASASEVAAGRQGDCSEFAVLTAALCRAVGIPAKVVVGVAYVEDFMGIQGFGGHAWDQAWIGDRWVGLDAAFKSSGRGGYDAGHIALAVGDGEPADFFNLATTLGRFDIDKVIIKRK